MTDKIDFNDSTIGILSDTIKGKTVESVENDNGYDDTFTIRFNDGTALRIRYDYIYEWELVQEKR